MDQEQVEQIGDRERREEQARMRSQLKGEEIGDYRTRRRGRPAAGRKGAAEQRATDRRMHGEEGMERDEYETGLKDMMEEEEWKEEAGIDMNDEGGERMREDEDERMNIVDNRQKRSRGEGNWEDRVKRDMKMFEEHLGREGKDLQHSGRGMDETTEDMG